jgi:hypothetical protein
MTRASIFGLAVALAGGLSAAPDESDSARKNGPPTQERSILGKAADGVKKGVQGVKDGAGAVAETTRGGAKAVAKTTSKGATAVAGATGGRRNDRRQRRCQRGQGNR